MQFLQAIYRAQKSSLTFTILKKKNQVCLHQTPQFPTSFLKFFYFWALRRYVMPKPVIGSKAHNFELRDQNGDMIALQPLLSKQNIVLYFYPKDETPGCIREACGFRDEYESFLEVGAQVVGISADSVRSHKRFAENRKLPFILLSDPSLNVHRVYGAEPNFFGMLRARVTFVIDKEGTIRHVFDSKLNFLGHVKSSLEVLQSLSQ